MGIFPLCFSDMSLGNGNSKCLARAALVSVGGNASSSGRGTNERSGRVGEPSRATSRDSDLGLSARSICKGVRQLVFTIWPLIGVEGMALTSIVSPSPASLMSNANASPA